MESALIWWSALAAALFAVALAVRVPRPLGTAVQLVAGLACLASFALVTFLAYAAGATPWALATSVAYVLGAAAVIGWGRTSEAPGLPPRAASWPIARLAFALAVSVGVLVTSARNAQLAAEQALATRRAELASLDQMFWPAVPDAANAAPIYARAYAHIVPLDAVPGAHAAFDADRVTSAELLDWTRRNDAALTLAEEGAQRPGYASVEDALWRNNPASAGREGKILRLEMARKGHDPSTVDNELSRRRIGDLLQTRSLQRAAQGEAELAVDDANALFALTDQTSSPWLKPERLAARLVAARGMTKAALEKLRVPRGPGAQARLQRILIRSEHAELAFANRFYETRDPLDHLFKSVHGAFWARDWLTRTEHSYDELWEAAYAPPSERLARLHAVKAQQGLFRFMDSFVPEVVTRIEAALRDEAERSCAVAGVALAQYHAAHHAFPQRLEDLGLSDLPQDPYTGGALRYERTAAGAKVSAGPATFVVPG